jgi:hypothetical protein
MIIPNKYKNTSQNIFSLGKNILEILDKRDREIYNLYKDVIEKRIDEFEVDLKLFFFSLDFLYTLELIDLKEGRIIRK